MKKITLVLYFLSLALFVSAQTGAADHFTFMGIPITGSPKSFAASLQKKGFRPLVVEDEMVKMTGMFAQNDVDVLLLPTSKTNIIYAVAVTFQDRKSWILLKSDYLNFKKDLSNKYGKPTISKEFFSNPYYDGDGYEMTAVRSGNATFASIWMQEIGDIMLSISDGGHIQLFYIDNINKAIKDIEDKEIVHDDL